MLPYCMKILVLSYCILQLSIVWVAHYRGMLQKTVTRCTQCWPSNQNRKKIILWPCFQSNDHLSSSSYRLCSTHATIQHHFSSRGGHHDMFSCMLSTECACVRVCVYACMYVWVCMWEVLKGRGQESMFSLKWWNNTTNGHILQMLISNSGSWSRRGARKGNDCSGTKWPRPEVGPTKHWSKFHTTSNFVRCVK